MINFRFLKLLKMIKMKKLIFFFFSIYNIVYLGSQNLIKFKNGEQIKANILSLNDSIVNVDYRGGVLLIKRNEISSIDFENKVFNEKKTDKFGILKGVVTYFFNDNLGDKPDVGAEIRIIDVKKINGPNNNIDTALMKDFTFVKHCRQSIYEDFRKSKPLDSFCLKYVKKYKALTKEEWRNYCGIVYSNLLSMETVFNLEVISLTVDGSGNFYKKLKPGRYAILSISKGRSEHNVAENLGKIQFNIIEIKEDEEEVLSFRFDLD